MCWDPRTYALCVRQMAVGEQIDRLVGLGVEFGKLARSGELRAREDALRQFEMIADIEELDRVAVILGKFEKGVSARGDDPAAELRRLRDRPRRGLPDLEIGKHHRIADRHAGQEFAVVERTHEMDPRGTVTKCKGAATGGR